MVFFDVNVTAELLIQKLKLEKPIAEYSISTCRTIGLRTMTTYFKDIDKVWIDKEDSRNYLEHQYELFYKDDPSLVWRWKIIRRSAELLVYFATTGNVNMPSLPRWSKRDCLLYIKPTNEQLEENDNIYGLTWRTRKALNKFEYADRTLNYYDSSGFLKILEAYKQEECDIYSRKINATLVLEAQKRVSEGKQDRFQAIRKAVALLDEFHRYGTLNPSRLCSFDSDNLSPIFESLMDEYANDAILSGKLRPYTADTAKSIIKGFLTTLEKHRFYSFEKMTLSITSAILIETAENHYKAGAAALIHYMRDFFKYLYEYKHIENDLSVAIPKMAAPAEKVYQGFSDNEIRQLLAAVDRTTFVGKRDYAIMMLATQTGLRAIDIGNLRRSDIDWHKQEIHVIQSKTGKPLILTLEVESGNAIFDYLINARQKCPLPNVFLCSNYPLRAIQRSTINGIVKKYLKIAGIKLSKHQRCGLHGFRRALGTRLLESGTPAQLLSQLLGHSRINSAKPYMSASENELKKCCLSLTFKETRGNLL